MMNALRRLLNHREVLAGLFVLLLGLVCLAAVGDLDIVLENWLGVSGPAGMPADLTRKIHDSVAEAVALPAVQEKLLSWGVESKTMSTAEYTQFVAQQIDVWRPLIIEAGAQEK